MKEPILTCENINKKFKKKDHYHVAAKDISFRVYKGDCLAIVGESGSGKSTLARMIMNLEKVDSGKIYLGDMDITNVKRGKLQDVYRKIQMVFQDASGSFDGKHTIGASIMEYICSLCTVTKEGREKKLDELLSMVSLPVEFKRRYPHELSGGQCQRAAIARALASHPKILICDEATSALDVSVAAQVVELLMEMKDNLNISYIFITHDIALASTFCNRIIVMKDGEIVEEGITKEVLENPKMEYTKSLLSAVI